MWLPRGGREWVRTFLHSALAQLSSHWVPTGGSAEFPSNPVLEARRQVSGTFAKRIPEGKMPMRCHPGSIRAHHSIHGEGALLLTLHEGAGPRIISTPNHLHLLSLIPCLDLIMQMNPYRALAILFRMATRRLER